jgi:predicted RNase H-like nuclease (RuvC/YqgF family)
VYLILLDEDEPTYKELVNINNKSNDTIKELNSIINSYKDNNYEFRALCKLVKKLYDDDIECRCKIKEQAVEIKALKEKLKTWKCKKGVM